MDSVADRDFAAEFLFNSCMVIDAFIETGRRIDLMVIFGIRIFVLFLMSFAPAPA